MSKSGTGKDYLLRYLSSPEKSIVVMRKSLRNPEEQDDHKKRDVKQSAPTHTRHTHTHLGGPLIK